jgi:hypothetical protein
MKWRILIVGLLVLMLAVLALPMVSAAPAEISESAEPAYVAGVGLDKACIQMVCSPSINGGLECKFRVIELPYFKIDPNSG